MMNWCRFSCADRRRGKVCRIAIKGVKFYPLEQAPKLLHSASELFIQKCAVWDHWIKMYRVVWAVPDHGGVQVRMTWIVRCGAYVSLCDNFYAFLSFVLG